MFLIIIAGFPAAMQSEGMSLVTILPAPMILLAPMRTPFSTIQFVPINTSSSIMISLSNAICHINNTVSSMEEI